MAVSFRVAVTTRRPAPRFPPATILPSLWVATSGKRGFNYPAGQTGWEKIRIMKSAR